MPRKVKLTRRESRQAKLIEKLESDNRYIHSRFNSANDSLDEYREKLEESKKLQEELYRSYKNDYKEMESQVEWMRNLIEMVTVPEAVLRQRSEHKLKMFEIETQDRRPY